MSRAARKWPRRNLSEMRILVTGASGFIGAPLMRELERRGGHRLFVLPSERFAAERLAGVRYETVAKAGSARAVVVYHLAGPPIDARLDAAEYERLITGGAARLLDQLRGAPPERLIVAGSAAEYGSGHGWREDDAPRPDTLFGRLKLAAGNLAFGAHWIPVVARLRLFTPFGPGEPGARLIPSAVGAARAGERLRLRSTGEQTRDYVPLSDAVGALASAATACLEPRSILNICTGEPRTALDAARRVFALAGGDPASVEPGEETPAALQRSSGDATLAARLLAWHPRQTFDAAVAALLAPTSKETLPCLTN